MMDTNSVKYVGNMSQISDIREYCVESGRARGMRIYQFQPGNGLLFDVMPDKCLDIARLSYRGVNINWQSKTGFSNVAQAHPVLNEFDRYFSGGMLTTCGLRNTGPDYTDESGKFQMYHGRIGVTPCEQAWRRCYFEKDDYILEAGGVTRDSVLGSYNLTLTRIMKTSLKRAEIEITDTLENWEPEEAEYLILYHFNLGFPFAGPDTKITLPPAKSAIVPRTPAAAAGIAEWNCLGEAVDNYEEQCFFHDPMAAEDGYCHALIENPKVGIRLNLAYEPTYMPILTEWKSLRSGEYALGIEPGNSHISGFQNESKAGRVGTVEAFGKRVFRLKLRFETM